MNYDVVVIGGGHAGIEASHAAAKMGAKTLLVTILAEQIGAASCNPAIGGLAKGHLVKELDALGGVMGTLTDACGIQFRVLNESKGAAVRGSRAQIDMDSYKKAARNLLLATPNLTITQEIAEEILTENGEVSGVRTHLGNIYTTKKLVITTGTFLNGLIHVGEKKLSAGRVGEFASSDLGLKKLGLKTGRLKTGTCPRVLGSSIDFSVFEEQGGDANPTAFSFKTREFKPMQMPCYIAYTNEKTHEIIRQNFYRAPLFTGQIEGVGPRYCPSIEDKVNRFSERNRHHLFVEPQTKEATEFYINGFSTSLPYDTQVAALRSVKGFENAIITRHGYAIEYDYVEPTELYHSLETKRIKGLFLAGQINGTTGYEEAAAQGLVAGINAVLSLRGEKPFVLARNEGYIGVLVDDLVTKGTKEPYRMFTSRAEFRLLLREENAVLRLSGYGHKFGLLSDDEFAFVSNLKNEVEHAMAILSSEYATSSEAFCSFLGELGEEAITQKTSLVKLVGKSTFNAQKLARFGEIFDICAQREVERKGEFEAFKAFFETLSQKAKELVVTAAKYYHYELIQQDEVEKMKRLMDVKIPRGFDFTSVKGLSKEIVEKLQLFTPETLAAASQISGVTPAALDILHIMIKKAAKNEA